MEYTDFIHDLTTEILYDIFPCGYSQDDSYYDLQLYFKKLGNMIYEKKSKEIINTQMTYIVEFDETLIPFKNMEVIVQIFVKKCEDYVKVMNY